MKLLLIDDDIVDRMNAVRLLKNSGQDIYISETDSPETGIKMAQENDYDLILLDYQLPGMNGLEVLSFLKKTDVEGAAVVILSHSEDDELALQCIKSGAQDYVKKSEVTTSRLIRALTHAQQRFQIEMQLRSSREQLRKLAETDSLTGLANRYNFEISLKSSMKVANRHHYSMALLMLDLDKFKQINDTLGHAAGDELLVSVAERLGKELRSEELLSRLGGDEFAILMQHIDRPSQASALAKRIQQLFELPFTLQGKPHQISFSIGIAIYPDCADCAEQLLKFADVAMYRSKESGRNQINFYSKAIHQRVLQRIALESRLTEAWKRSEFELYYQPQICTKDNRLVGVEALLRWHSPKYGTTPPSEFVPIAEETGLIHAIGRWVLETACAQWHRWNLAVGNLDDMPSLSINVSAVQLKQSDLVAQVRESMETYQIPPEKLEIELTESYLEISHQATQLMSELSGMGVKLALDDFGTGFASLANLQRHPFDILKIDRSFVGLINDDTQNDKFVRALVEFANAIGYITIAEGVETATQNQACIAMGVDRIQGYFYARPLDPKQLEQLWLMPSGKKPH